MLAVVAAVLVGTVAVPWGAAAESNPRVLQAVHVTLGLDGGITNLTSTTVTRGTTAYATNTTQLDPATLASKLPVRVQLSDMINGKPGADLTSLAGATGQVELDITVSNTTLHAESITHPSSSDVPTTSEALVGMPLTVVANATLPSGTGGEVVVDEGGNQMDQTNGVLSPNANGTSNVEWSALLAPPQVSPTTTFRLVEQTDHFQLPSFSLTVQPGIDTDPSLGGELESSFTDQSQGSGISAQNAADMLVERIDSKLGNVSTELGQISSTLQTQSQQIGPAATRALRGANADIHARSQTIEADLHSLGGKVSDRLHSTSQTASAALTRLVQRLETRLGVTPGQPSDDHPPTPSGTASGCTAQHPGTPSVTGHSLFAQLDQISGQVEALSGATSACFKSLRTTLTEEIGPVTAAATTCDAADPTTSHSVYCRIDAAAGRVSDLTDVIDGTRVANINSQLSSASFGDVSTDIGKLGNDISTVQNDISTVDSDAGGISQGLGQAENNLGNDIGVAQTDTAAFGQVVDSLHSEAKSQASLLDDRNSSSVASEVETLDNLICQGPFQLADGIGNLYTEQVLALLGGSQTQCAGDTATNDPGGSIATSYSESLTTFLNTDAADWQQLEAATDSSGGLTSAVAVVSTDLDSLAADLSALPNTTTVGKDLDQLTTDGKALSGGGTPGVAACRQGGLSDLQTLLCATDDFTAAQSLAANRFTKLIATLHRRIGGRATSLTAIGNKAQQDVGQTTQQFRALLGSLSSTAKTTARNVLTSGGATLRTQENRLAMTSKLAGRHLNSTAMNEISTLGNAFGHARTVQHNEETQLTNEVRDVIGNIGATHQGGLLGAIGNDVSNTSADITQIGQASDVGHTFSTVGKLALSSDLLQRAQLRKGLMAAANYPAFGIELPPGSQSTTLFVFSMSAG